MNLKKLFSKRLAGILLVLLASVAAVILVKTRPVAQRRPMSSMIPVVLATGLQPMTTSVTVRCMGTVIADVEAALEAQVSGRITDVHPELLEGTLVRQGEVLITIDASDYVLAVERAAAALLRAESSLRSEEGSQAVAKHEMELIRGGAEVDPAYQDLMLRVPQLKAAQADVETARVNLAAAQLDLERTQIKAPFDAVILAVSGREGDIARPGRTLLRLAASNRFFVRASVPVDTLGAFPPGDKRYTARVVLIDGGVREGVLHQLLPDLSAQGRMARLLVSVEQPLAPGSGRPLLLNEYVRLELDGREVDEVFLIDRRYLRDGESVWMLDEEERLRICPAVAVQGYDDHMLVQIDLPPDFSARGWQMIISGIPAPVEGMQVRLYADREEEMAP